MSKIIIVVNGSVYGATASRRALKYTQAALTEGHEITRVFFYQDGVYNTSALVSPASDEFDLVQEWQQLAQAHDVELVNCVSAALRRGVLSAQDAQENQKEQYNLAKGFQMGGLGELVTGIEASERMVSF
ncbi:sulfurtransferase complex subunit TusD [Shewanella gelidii]|nr:sulfurtransferase complex subunit TusD [Shewanella gelidii]MCL1098026.1 sulfurtransferase complex subunit TusD [Shewanella gelidii]